MDPPGGEEMASSSKTEKMFEKEDFIEFVIENDQLIKLRGENVRRGENEDCLIMGYGGSVIPYHESVLAAFCGGDERPYEMFFLKFPGTCLMNREIFEKFLTFFYTGKIIFQKRHFFKYFIAAEYLSISVFLDKAKLYLEENILSPSNVIQTLFKSTYVSDSFYLQEKCFMYFMQNYTKIFQSDDFLRLPYSDQEMNIGKFLNTFLEIPIRPYSAEIRSSIIREYYGSNYEEIDKKIEEVKFHAVVCWTKHNSDRLKHFLDLLIKIKFETLSSQFVKGVIANTPELLRYPTCCELMIDLIAHLKDINFQTSYIFDLLCCIYAEKTGGRTNESLKLLAEFSETAKAQNILRSHEKETTSKFFPIVQKTSKDQHHLGRNRNLKKDEILFCLGGVEVLKNTTANLLSSVSQYVSKTGWVTSTPMLEKRSNFGAVSVNSTDGRKIYICGGNAEQGMVLDSLHVYDLNTNQWTRLAPLPEPRSGCSMTFFNGDLYLAGGESEDHVWQSTCFRYSLADGTWSSVPSMTHPRTGLKLIALSGFLYAIGGFVFTAEKYDPKTDEWTIIPQTKNILAVFGAVAHRGVLFVCGPGIFQAFFQDKWVNLPLLDRNYAPELVSFNGRLLAVGGFRNETSREQIYEYKFYSDISDGYWVPFVDMDTQRVFQSVVVLPNQSENSFKEKIKGNKMVAFEIDHEVLFYLRSKNVTRGKKEDCSVIIKSNGKPISAHKSVLQTFSNTIRKKIPKYKLNNDFTIEINLNEEIFEQFLTFVYTGKVSFPEKDFFKYYDAFNYLESWDLLDGAEHYFQEKIFSASNPISLLLNEENFSISLYNIVFEYFSKKYKQTSPNEEFLELTFHNLDANTIHSISSMLSLNKPFETFYDSIQDLEQLLEKAKEISFHTIIYWTRHKPSDRSKHLFSLLKTIDFKTLSSQFVREVIAKTTEVLEYPTCCELLVFLAKQMTKLENSDKSSVVDLYSSIYAAKTSQSINERLVFLREFSQVNAQNIQSDDREMTDSNERENFFTSQILENTDLEVNQTERLYCLGGLDILKHMQSSMSQFQSGTGWRVAAPMLNERYEFGAAASNDNKIYVCGGYTHLDLLLNSLHVYDPEDHNQQNWMPLTPLPETRMGCAMAFLDGYLYLAGGQSENFLPSSTGYRYSPDTDRWEPILPMNNPRCGHRLIAMGNYLYAIGGGMFIVERFDPISGQWTTMPQMEMNSHYASFGAVAHQGKFFACGPDDFQSYDSSQENAGWITLPALDIGIGTELVSFDGRLLAVGGCTHETLTPSLEVYEFNFSENRWIPFEEMDTYRAFHCAVVVKVFQNALE